MSAEDELVGLFGSAHMDPTGEQLRALVKTHRAVVVNSWQGGQHSWCGTGEKNSRIDVVFVPASALATTDMVGSVLLDMCQLFVRRLGVVCCRLVVRLCCHVASPSAQCGGGSEAQESDPGKLGAGGATRRSDEAFDGLFGAFSSS